MDTRNVLTLKEAAEKLGISSATLRSQIRFGNLKTKKFGSVHAVATSEVERYRRENLGRYGKKSNKEEK